MGFRLASANKVKITKALATQWASMSRLPQDRSIGSVRMIKHEKSLRDGNFKVCNWAKAFCKADGVEYRVNGNHTAHLFAIYADEFPGHYALIESYECDTFDDVCRLWSTFDPSASSRNSSDINSIVASGVPELRDTPRRVLDILAAGVNFSIEGGSTAELSRKTADQKARVAFWDNKPFCIWASGILFDSKQFSCMLRMGVTAAMFATWGKSHSAANTYWTLVRDELGDRPNAPHRQYHRWLLMTRARSGTIGSKVLAAPREYYVRGILAWNAYRRGEEPKQFRYKHSMAVPEVE